MFITCDLYYLKDNYILHFSGNDITSKFIEDTKNRNITRVAIKNDEISYDCDCFKPIFLTVFMDNKVTIRKDEISYSNDPFKPIYVTIYVNGVLRRNKIVVFDKNNHVEQFKETYDRLFGKQDNISKDSSNNTNNKVKLWQKVFLKLIKNCMLFMMRLKKQVEK